LHIKSFLNNNYSGHNSVSIVAQTGSLLYRRLATCSGTRAQPTLERPPRPDFGDYSTNAAMLLSPVLKQPPRAIAERVKTDRYIRAKVERMAELMAAYLTMDTKRPPHESLSNREFQVMRQIASGKTVSQIARELSLSVRTVSTYRTRILEKTGMKSNAELTHYAFQHQLVS